MCCGFPYLIRLCSCSCSCFYFCFRFCFFFFFRFPYLLASMMSVVRRIDPSCAECEVKGMRLQVHICTVIAHRACLLATADCLLVQTTRRQRMLCSLRQSDSTLFGEFAEEWCSMFVTRRVSQLLQDDSLNSSGRISIPRSILLAKVLQSTIYLWRQHGTSIICLDESRWNHLRQASYRTT